MEQTFDARNVERYGIESWISGGWDVEVWDLSSWIFPDAQESSRERARFFSGYIAVRSTEDLARRCGEGGRVDYFLDLTGSDLRAFDAKLKLTEMGAIRIVCDLGSFPEPADDMGVRLRSAALKAIVAGPRELLRRVGERRERSRRSRMVKPGVFIASGERSVQAGKKMVSVDRIVFGHNLDYDVYLRALHDPSPVFGSQSVVFLDQDLCFHSDFVREKEQFWVTPEHYFPAIGRSLDRIALAFGTGAVIAAHPRARYAEHRNDVFGRVPVIFGRTAELIRDANVVVCHFSTAIQLAVLFGKPLLFITTDQLVRSRGDAYVRCVATALGRRVFNADDDWTRVDFREECRVDVGKYAEYRNRYIKTDGSPAGLLWQNVAKQLQSGDFDQSSRVIDPAG